MENTCGFQIEDEGGAGNPAALVPLEKKVEIAKDNFQARAEKMVREFSAFVVNSPETFTLADVKITQGMNLIKGIRSYWDPVCDSAFKTHKISTTTRKKLIDPIDEVTKRLGRLMADYELERDRKIAAERKALEDKAKKEQEEAVAAQVKEMEAAKAPPEVIKEVQKLADQPVQVEAPATTVLRSKTGFTLDWEIRVEDKSLVPPEYLVVDEAAILKVVRATKGQVKVPGVKVNEIRKVTRRSANK